MEIRPILSSLRRHKTAAALIVLEIALSCAILCNAIFLVNGRRISGFREIRGIPPEAIERFDILPEEGYRVDTILERAETLVRRKGIRVFILDPYNCLEHQIPSGQSETQYISEFLEKLRSFARRRSTSRPAGQAARVCR